MLGYLVMWWSTSSEARTTLRKYVRYCKTMQIIINNRSKTMTKYQLIYNGHQSALLLDTLKEAEGFKQKAADAWPEITVEIKQVEEQDNE
tara:strand:+ start:560 stop:829 length:270 start_codon:yes stop_codon:yes gene_type:complete